MFKLSIGIMAILLSFSALCSDFSIKRFSGDVVIDNVKLTKKNQKNVKLNEGSTIVANGKKSFVQVRSDLGSVFLVRNGKLVLTSVSAKKTSVQLVKGKFFHYFNKAKKREFTVKTKNAVMGVRGTKYMVQASEDKTYLCVCEGKVAINKKDNAKEYLIKKDFDIDIETGKETRAPRDASKMMKEVSYGEFASMGYPIK